MNIQTTYKELLERVRREGTATGRNLVAFSGGVDSSLVARAVYTVFPENSEAVMALSPSVSTEMRTLAEDVAAQVGIPLRFVHIEEYRDPQYVANEGMSCYVCKSHIYDALRAISREAVAQDGEVLLYNGTNADDSTDPTRVGLRAAREYAVRSPLDTFSKDTVRALSRHAGLPNWQHAATPCLRSRLQAGVPATPDHLRRVETAEATLRTLFAVPVTVNFRVRHVRDGTAVVEIDEQLLDHVELSRCRDILRELGYRDVTRRAFRSGSVSADIEAPAT
ncbi:MAG: TIGR00268 family protein [Bacteroidota bacterium]|nr:TIGR00268 family protein [Bacteroidota bacterium]